MIGFPEMIVILFAAAIFLFGKDQAIEWAKALGKARKEFNDTMDDAKGAMDKSEKGEKKKKDHRGEGAAEGAQKADSPSQEKQAA